MDFCQLPMACGWRGTRRSRGNLFARRHEIQRRRKAHPFFGLFLKYVAKYPVPLQGTNLFVSGTQGITFVALHAPNVHPWANFPAGLQPAAAVMGGNCVGDGVGIEAWSRKVYEASAVAGIALVRRQVIFSRRRRQKAVAMARAGG
jgi:hypothetical protein